MRHPQMRLYLGPPADLGPGKVELLARIRATGSIAEAARAMGMSYNRAWWHIRAMNLRFKLPVVVSMRGGSAGGGARLTKTGEEVVALYRQMESQVEEATAMMRCRLFRLLRG